jgi:YcxB-like protein
MSRLCFRRLALANKVTELTLADDGIHFVTSVSTGTVPWQAITRVIENRRGLYLAVSKLEAVLIPRRAASEADFSRMRDQIEQRLRAKES